MDKEREMFKTLVAVIISGFLHIFEIFPIQSKKILFFPINGHYYCNLKYLDEKMREEGLSVTSVWVSHNDVDLSYPIGIKYVKKNSLAMLYHFFTSSVIISNNGIPSWLYKRNRQSFIETWHGGGAYKKIDTIHNKWKLLRVETAWKRIDYIVSSCKKFTEAFKKDTGINTKFLSIGMPRNDIFFDKIKMQDAATLVRKTYQIDKSVGIVLYAPTFRDNGILIDLNVSELLHSLQLRFRKPFVLLVRSHPHLTKDIFAKSQKQENLIDVSNYVDMQELLAAADVLVTDYSSSIWDFSFTGRPCFIYANDLTSYKKERGFHTPIDKWPFPLAERNEELKDEILNFNEDTYAAQIKHHHVELGSYESGNAASELCKIIICLMNDSDSQLGNK